MIPQSVLDAGMVAMPKYTEDMDEKDLDRVFRAMLRALAEDHETLTIAGQAIHETAPHPEWCFIDGSEKTEYCRKARSALLSLAGEP